MASPWSVLLSSDFWGISRSQRIYGDCLLSSSAGLRTCSELSLVLFNVSKDGEFPRTRTLPFLVIEGLCSSLSSGCLTESCKWSGLVLTFPAFRIASEVFEICKFSRTKTLSLTTDVFCSSWSHLPTEWQKRFELWLIRVSVSLSLRFLAFDKCDLSTTWKPCLGSTSTCSLSPSIVFLFINSKSFSEKRRLSGWIPQRSPFFPFLANNRSGTVGRSAFGKT